MGSRSTPIGTPPLRRFPTCDQCSRPDSSGVPVRRLFTAGVELRYLPPYSPDLNPIENAFAKLKAFLRKAAERTMDGLWRAIGRLIDQITPAESANMFRRSRI